MEAFLIKIFFHPVTLTILGILAILDTDIPWRIEMFIKRLKAQITCYYLNKITDYIRSWSLSYIRCHVLKMYCKYWSDDYWPYFINAGIFIPTVDPYLFKINRDIL